ncbi:hypothetical protein F383_38996 [Gossypium arboreum]|uniref:Uncharacterized protein n=1 Tax=Gossypium arboreum TaxID=29729 RepID=A0A0B0MJF0_GOSAR|nr:hypothetical protein F383_38996 [Gossypium arboreum]
MCTSKTLSGIVASICGYNICVTTRIRA